MIRREVGGGLVDLDLRIDRQDNCVVLNVTGELDAYSSPRLRDLFEELCEGEGEGGDPVVVNLSGITFADSTALGALVSGLRLFRARDRRLLLCSAPKNVRRILDIAGLTRLFEIYDSVEEACVSP